MQNAELFRRGVVLPLDDLAEEALRSTGVGEGTNVRLLRLNGEGVFEALRLLGLFRAINNRCATMLDDHEEDWVDAATVVGVIGAVDEVIPDAPVRPPEIIACLEGLRELARQAGRSSRPLLFVL